MSRFDAIVLAGGAARRLGGVDKPMLAVQGRPMLVHVLDAAQEAGQRIVVGPARAGIGDVEWAQEHPRGGGPVAGLAAGLPLTRADLVYVLAADQPWIGGALRPLLLALEASPRSDVAVLQTDERPNPLAALWRRRGLTDALGRLPAPANSAMYSLLAAASVVTVADTGGWSRDYDTWQDLEESR